MQGSIKAFRNILLVILSITILKTITYYGFVLLFSIVDTDILTNMHIISSVIAVVGTMVAGCFYDEEA